MDNYKGVRFLQNELAIEQALVEFDSSDTLHIYCSYMGLKSVKVQMFFEDFVSQLHHLLTSMQGSKFHY